MAPEDNDAMASWSDYRRHVVGELERLNDIIERFDSKLDKIVEDHRKEIAARDIEIWKSITDLRISVAMLEVKSGVWGAAAGLLVVIVSVLLKMIHPL